MSDHVETDDAGLSRVVQSSFDSSPNPAFRRMTKKPEIEATYDPDRIFIGWSLGGKTLFEQLVDRYKTRLKRQGITDYRSLRNDAILYALEEFPDHLGNEKWVEPVFMDRASADVLLMGGQRGSGKSFNIRAMSNRSAEAGVTNILLDPKHEYYTNPMYRGIQSDLAYLRDGESPTPIQTVVLMPYFVYKARQDKGLPQSGYDYVNVFQFSFDDLTADEIHFILTNLDDHRDYQVLASEVSYRVKDRNYRVESWDDVFAIAWELDEEGAFNWDNGQRVRQLKNTVRTTYQNYEFLGKNRPIERREPGEDGITYRNLAECLQKYNTVVLSLQDGDALPSSLKMKELYVAILIKKVRNLRQRNVVPGPISWRFDEAHKIVPQQYTVREYPSKKQARQMIKEDRSLGFRIDLATQTPNDLDMDNFLDQLRHVFIPQNMSDTSRTSGEPSPRKIMLSLGRVYESADRQRGKWDAIFDAMAEVFEYSWLYIDKKRDYWTVLRPASPLANHLQE
ncbi:ATP-binding protein [Halorarum salinum]|uniref:ATP-binding protein n=1 Tax=Halorarum salinum TaxID=2743089 RepID=A0A7D5LBE9_9EURY|nr:ATP-binding protein [Halobaculum salinum]QLG61969.1 ATP-binding protein [Halobaculum salinum]